MTGLSGLLQALGLSPDWRRCIVENQVGQDEYCWVHYVPEGADRKLVVYIDLGLNGSVDLKRSVASLGEYREKLAPALQSPFPDVVQVAESGRLSGAVQRTAAGARPLSVALRVREGVNSRLASGLDRIFAWWTQVAGERTISGVPGERLTSILETAAVSGVCSAGDLESLRQAASKWDVWPVIPRFYTLKPSTVQVDPCGFRFQYGGRFKAEDPFWADLFDLRATIFDFMHQESKKAADATNLWFAERTASVFRQFGIDDAQERFMTLVVDLERLSDYYQVQHPDAAGRRRLRQRVQQEIQGLQGS